MRAKPIIINNRKPFYVLISIATIAAMTLMALLVRPALADEEATTSCTVETVPDTSGKADYTYKLDPDCTLHLEPTNIPSRGNDSPIQQHDKVRRIVFDDPTQTKLNEDSSYLFYGYPKAESIEGIDKLDVSHVQVFDKIFADLDLKKPANLSSWNVSSGWDFSSMFNGSNLDGFDGIGNFVFGSNQEYSLIFSNMFDNATSTKGIDLSDWHFPNTLNNPIITRYMFDGAKTPKIDVSSFSGLDMSIADYMFANTNAEIDGLDQLITLHQSAQHMFENAKPTNKVDLSSWNTEKLDNADNMFKGSDIDKFSGMNHWSLPKLNYANDMYANLDPTHQVRIQTSMPSLVYSAGMFSGSNLDMFPDIPNLQLSPTGGLNASVDSMFEDARGTYVNVSGWTNGKGLTAYGMFDSPYIKFMTFGDKTVGRVSWAHDFAVEENNHIFKKFNGVNVWDRPDLPKEYFSKKWATLPIKQECEAKFDGNPDKISDDCRDDSRSWVSDKAGIEADNELFNSDNYHRIFFRVASIPVTFNANGVENVHDMPPSMNFNRLYTKNDDIIPPEWPQDETGGRKFISYNTQADGSGRTYYPGDHFGHDVDSLTLYAQWKITNRTIRFIDQSNEAENLPDEVTLPYDSDYTIPDQIPTRPNYDFIGWATSWDNKIYHPGDTIKININDAINFYAQWKAHNYSIRFIDPSKESNNLPDGGTAPYGSDYTISDRIPTRRGYSFIGWSVEENGQVQYLPGETFKITSDISFYAQWKANDYSIKFIDPSKEGEGIPDTVIISYGSDYTIPDQAPTRNGYDFNGWAVEKNGQAKYQPKDVIKVTSDLNLYAVWSKKAPSVKFNNNGGEGATPTTKPVENDNTKIEVDCTDKPSKDGATFIGWSKTKNDVLEGSDAGEKGQIAVCGYSGKRTITGLQGKTIDLYATWAKRPQAFFKENRPKDMTALLPETRSITGDWAVDDSTPRTYVAPNIDGWYKSYSPDGVYRFDGWVSEDGAPFTGAYLERNDMTINAKWSRIKEAEVPPEDNNHTDDNGQDHDDNQDNNKPSDDNDNSIGGSNSGNHGSNDNDNPHKEPVVEEKPSAPGNESAPDGISSISNNSNQMNSGHSDSGDRSDVGDKDASGSSNSETVDDTADSDNGNKGSRLASTGANLIPPAVLIILSTAVFMIVRRLKRKA